MAQTADAIAKYLVHDVMYGRGLGAFAACREGIYHPGSDTLATCTHAEWGRHSVICSKAHNGKRLAAIGRNEWARTEGGELYVLDAFYIAVLDEGEDPHNAYAKRGIVINSKTGKIVECSPSEKLKMEDKWAAWIDLMAKKVAG